MALALDQIDHNLGDLRGPERPHLHSFRRLSGRYATQVHAKRTRKREPPMRRSSIVTFHVEVSCSYSNAAESSRSCHDTTRVRKHKLAMTVWLDGYAVVVPALPPQGCVTPSRGRGRESHQAAAQKGQDERSGRCGQARRPTTGGRPWPPIERPAVITSSYSDAKWRRRWLGPFNSHPRSHTKELPSV